MKVNLIVFSHKEGKQKSCLLNNHNIFEFIPNLLLHNYKDGDSDIYVAILTFHTKTCKLTFYVINVINSERSRNVTKSSI